MRTKSIFTISLLLLAQLTFSQSALKRKTIWTVSKVREWSENNKNTPTWHGWLLYQGSDTATHHFISRVMDEWIWFNIKRADLAIKDERQYKTTSSAPLGHYYVDATKDFVKIKDY
jgi:hypothetical protein